MYELKCEQCFATFLVEYSRYPVAGNFPKFCVMCGASAPVPCVTKIDSYWFDLAKAFGFKNDRTGAELIQNFYELWDTTRYTKFRDFMTIEVLQNPDFSEILQEVLA